MTRHIEPIVRQLAAARYEQGVSGRALAKRLGLSESVVHNWENGHHQPTVTGLRLWAAELGLALTLTPKDPP